jgi:putative endonuclease
MNRNYLKKWFKSESFPSRLDKDQVGKLGEKYAENYLRKHCYTIVETNYRNKLGEIDIIAGEGKLLVFVEVKTRYFNMPLNSPGEAVTMCKQRKIRQLAESFLRNYPADKWEQCRFDVIEIILNSQGTIAKINHLENAF